MSKRLPEQVEKLLQIFLNTPGIPACRDASKAVNEITLPLDRVPLVRLPKVTVSGYQGKIYIEPKSEPQTKNA
ncbi:MAG TPA: hypothetical protein VF828_02895 [Patescibacteria group bacterium]